MTFYNNTKDLKPALCIVNPDDKFYLGRYGTSGLENCVTPFEIEKLRNDGVVFPANRIAENTILVKLPHKDEYIYREPKDDENIIQENINTLSTILSYLGAKHAVRYVSNAENLDSKTKVDQDAHFDMSNSVSVTEPESSLNLGGDEEMSFDEEVHTNKTQFSNKAQSVFDENTWEGTYTEEGYKTAVRIATASGLIEQPDVKALLEQRNPSHPNHNLSKHYRVDLFSEFQKTLNVAVNLKANISKSLNLDKLAKADSHINASINVNVETSNYAKQHQIIDFSVEFGPLLKKTEVVPDKPKEIKSLYDTGTQTEKPVSLTTGKLIAIIAGVVVVAVALTVVAMKFLM